MKIRLAVFDMIGTTVHGGDEVPTAFREALGHVGVSLSNADIGAIRGRSKRDAIAKLLEKYLPDAPDPSALTESAYARFQEALRTAYRANVRWVAGAEEALRQLRLDGVEVVLTTGLDSETTALLLDSLDWASLKLSGVVTGDDVAHGRPAPDLIQAAMKLTGVEDLRSVLVVGDTTSDLDAAAAAGVGQSVGVLSGAHSRAQLEAHPHTAILDSVDELIPWLATGVVGAGPG